MFDLLHMRPRTGFWSVGSYWTAPEAAALWLDRDPEFLNFDTVAPYRNEPFGRLFYERHSLITRAQETDDLPQHLRPWMFLEWTDGLLMPLPPALREPIAEFERSRNSPAIIETSKATAEPADNYQGSGIDPREHRTLQFLVAAMAKDAYGYAHGAQRQTSTTKIVSAVERIGLKIDEATVLKHTRESMKVALEAANLNPNWD